MNILLLNLTRFGDLLQSQAAIADLARQGHAVAVLCLENFAEAATLLSGVSRVFSLPGAALLSSLAERKNRRAAAEGWRRSLARLVGLRDTIQSEFAPDLVCNLTPSLSARLLARFLAGDGPCTGFAVDAYGFGVNASPWATFLQGAGASRGVSPFNVVDIFRSVVASGVTDRERSAESSADVVFQPADADLRLPGEKERGVMLDRLLSLSPPDCQGYIALQLGASEERRRWPVPYFALLGDRLWREERMCPVLLGSGGEKMLAQRYTEAAGEPFIDLCGETGLTDLAAILCSCKMIISNDTGTMHYAAGLNIPVLAVFLATAQPFDTGPYRARSCSVEPDLSCHPCAFGTACASLVPVPQVMTSSGEFQQDHCEACRLAIHPERMAALALSCLRLGEWSLQDAEEHPSARVWISEYDSRGFMSLGSLSGHDSEVRSGWLLLQRHHMRQFLDRSRNVPFQPCPLPSPVSLPKEEGQALFGSLAAVSALLEVMLQQGRVLGVRPLPMMRQRFLSSWQKVHERLKSSPALGALALLWMQETQTEGGELASVLETAEHFRILLGALAADMSVAL